MKRICWKCGQPAEWWTLTEWGQMYACDKHNSLHLVADPVVGIRPVMQLIDATPHPALGIGQPCGG